MSSPEYDFFRIRDTAGTDLYWSTKLGWTDRELCDLFIAEDKTKAHLLALVSCEWVGVMFTNQYHCAECDVSWEDTWTCACDDKCPSCGKDIEATRSMDIDDE